MLILVLGVYPFSVFSMNILHSRYHVNAVGTTAQGLWYGDNWKGTIRLHFSSEMGSLQLVKDFMGLSNNCNDGAYIDTVFIVLSLAVGCKRIVSHTG